MGITIVQKSDLSVAKPFAQKALVLSGGAITGASFKAGGLKALNDYFANWSVNDFDIFVGISSGSFVSVPLAAGMTPEAILRSLDGTSKQFLQFAPWHFYWPNLKEVVTRPLRFCLDSLTYFPRAVGDLLGNWQSTAPYFAKTFWELVREPTWQHYTAFLNVVTATLTTSREGPSLLQMLPTGLFDNASVERYLRHNIERNHLTNNFKAVERLRHRRLYICAVNLDTAERVVFGPDEHPEVTISEAVQASTALPVFYKPARIRGVDYVDGGVFETSHIDVAIDKGAELIVCYNPFRPIANEVLWEYIQKDNRYVTKGRPLSTNGIMAIMNQIFRTVFHARLQQTMVHLEQNPHFRGDVIVIEPGASDMSFFELNPFIFSNRVKAARLGFESVRNSIDAHYAEIRKILKSYGIRLDRKRVDADYEQLKTSGTDAWKMQKVLEGRTDKRTPIAKKPVRSKRPTTPLLL